MVVLSTSSNHRGWSRFNFQLSFAHTLAERAHDTMGMDADEARKIVENSFVQAEEIAEQFVS